MQLAVLITDTLADTPLLFYSNLDVSISNFNRINRHRNKEPHYQLYHYKIIVITQYYLWLNTHFRFQIYDNFSKVLTQQHV